MIELDSEKWLAVRIACEMMASTNASPRLHPIYEWLVLAATHNAHVAMSAEDYAKKAQALLEREPK